MLRLKIVATLLAAALVVPLPARAGVTVERNFVTSFDGTQIVYNLFTPDSGGPFPAVFYGHGWSGTGQTEVAGLVKRLTDNGYAVVTWDARGFGDSGGETHVDDPAFEARDVSALIDMLAARPDIAQESPGDPVIGMASGSYAGGIQLVTAAFDSRVDAITPKATWNDLSFSLYPHGVTKAVLGSELFANGLKSSLADGADPQSTAGPQTGSYSPDLIQAMEGPVLLGAPDQASIDWWRARSYAGYGVAHPIAIPTLLIQGIGDPLFKVNEALRTYEDLKARGVDTNLVVVCSAHGPCPYAQDGDAHATDRILAWLDKYLKGTPTPPTPNVEFIDNEGTWRSAAVFGSASAVSASGSGTVVATGADTGTDPQNVNATRATPSRAGDPGTLVIETPVTGGDLIAGIPHVHVDLTLAGAGVHLFFKLVDREAKHAVDLQEMPLRIDGPILAKTAFDLDMTALAYRVPKNHHVDLQVATSSVQFLEYRSPAIVELDVQATIPAVAVEDPAPTPTPSPSASVSSEPTPGDPGTPSIVPLASVVAAGRVPHAGNTQVAFFATATRNTDGSVNGTFFMRDPATTGARVNTVGSVDTLTITGNRAVLEGPCDITGDPDARCRLVFLDVASPGRGADWGSFTAPGYAESGVLVDGEVIVQPG